MRQFFKLIAICLLSLGYFCLPWLAVAKEAHVLKKDHFLKADYVSYDAGQQLVIAVGKVFAKVDEYSLSADKIYYDLLNDTMWAQGSVKLRDQQNRLLYAEEITLDNKLKVGLVEKLIIRLDDHGLLAASRAKRAAHDKLILKYAAFSPCKIYCSRPPIWEINATRTELDYTAQKITYHNLYFKLYGMPIMFLPYFSHPTSHAQAHSGVLTPRIKDNSLLVPFYFRFSSELDVTITPRIARDYTIMQGEVRNLNEYGEINFQGSVSNQDKLGYHVFFKGDFEYNKFNYGFDIRKASDKAFLTNYYEIYDPYLTSKLYLNSINGSDYFLLEALHFQDFRKKDLQHSPPVILPNLKTLNVVQLEADPSYRFSVRTNSTFAQLSSYGHLLRLSLDLELNKNIITTNGQIIDATIANRSDLYSVSNIYSTKPDIRAHHVWQRQLPELRFKWRYPLMKPINQHTNLLVEPISTIVIGKKYKPSLAKFGFIDSDQVEITENNIFRPNRYVGIDHHDYGWRFNYGLTGSLQSKYLFLNGFIGQAIHKHNMPNQPNLTYIGNISADLTKEWQLFYRFQRSKTFDSMLDEVGLKTALPRFEGECSYAELHKVNKYFRSKNQPELPDHIAQINFKAKYMLIDNLWVGGDMKLDLSENHSRIFTKTIQMTYVYDCVSIHWSISDNFLHDSTRNVKKTKNYSVAIGLKFLNM